MKHPYPIILDLCLCRCSFFQSSRDGLNVISIHCIMLRKSKLWPHSGWLPQAEVEFKADWRRRRRPFCWSALKTEFNILGTRSYWVQVWALVSEMSLKPSPLPRSTSPASASASVSSSSSPLVLRTGGRGAVILITCICNCKRDRWKLLMFVPLMYWADKIEELKRRMLIARYCLFWVFSHFILSIHANWTN